MNCFKFIFLPSFLQQLQNPLGSNISRFAFGNLNSPSLNLCNFYFFASLIYSVFPRVFFKCWCFMSLKCNQIFKLSSSLQRFPQQRLMEPPGISIEDMLIKQNRLKTSLVLYPKRAGKPLLKRSLSGGRAGRSKSSVKRGGNIEPPSQENRRCSKWLHRQI